MAIPKIIHNTYKNHDLPDMYKRCQTEIKRLHPDFEYRFYTDDDMDRVMKTEFPDYYDKFNELPRMIMKIDMFRYFLMYKYGGLYTDMDYLMLNPFDLINESVVIPCNREDKDENPTCLGNCIFASEPNHPFWKSLMDTLFKIDRTKFDYNKDANIDGNILGTGPMFVFAMWKEYSTTNSDICISKRELFHPRTVLNKGRVGLNEGHLQSLQRKGCYGMHICTGLWRGKKL